MPRGPMDICCQTRSGATVSPPRHSRQAWQQTTGVIAVAGVGSKQSGEASSPEQEVRENEGYGWVLADESSQLAAIRGISV
jgi:hypothetical protein